MGNVGPAFVAVITGVIGLAIVAVLVAQKAQTPQVLQAGGSALASIIQMAVSPVSSNSFGSRGTQIGGVSQ